MLCPLISSSSFITTYPFAKILSKKYDVEIMGPLLGNNPYIEDKKLNFTFIEPKIKKPIQLAFLSLYKKNLKIIKKKDYDILHVFKLLPHTGPVGAKIHDLGKPFVLSIDDYDASATKNRFKRIVLKKAEKAYKKADAITVSSEGLRKIYGGNIIYQVANEFAFKKKQNIKPFLKKYNLEGKTIISHAGTFFDHKGIDILIKAVQKLNNKNVKLVLAGGNIEKYKKIANKETIFTGKLTIDDVAKLTEATDIYTIPTKDTPYSRVEIPAKIFEPMMMGKAIVASRISDIPKILNGSGLLTKPDSVDDLTEKIQYLIDNPKERKRLGTNAKKRYDEKYSYKQMEKKITKIYSRLA